MVTEIAAATAELLKLINNARGSHAEQQIEEAQSNAKHDVEIFKDAVLDRNLERINLLLGGMQHGILVRLTESESRELCAITPEIDGATLLALYARGRMADLTAQLGEIIRVASLPSTTVSALNAASNVSSAVTTVAKATGN